MNTMNLHNDLTEINADLSVISYPLMLSFLQLFRKRCSAHDFDSVDYSLFLDEQRDTLNALSITDKNMKWRLVSIDYYHGLQHHRFNSKANSQLQTFLQFFIGALQLNVYKFVGKLLEISEKHDFLIS